MKELTRYYNNQPVRVVEKFGEAWFVAKDVCDILDLGNSRDAVSALDEDERAVANIDTPGGMQKMNIISEAGLYSMIFRSRKEEAKSFKRWVTHTVLPTIRRTGAYVSTDLGLEDCLNMVNKLSAQLHEMMDSNAMLREKNAYLEQFAPKDEFGDLNKEGKPKVFQRKGCYVTAKGTEPARMDPDKNGYLQLDFFYDLLPSMMMDKIKGIILHLRSEKPELSE